MAQGKEHKTTRVKGVPQMSKAAFIRAQSHALSAKEVVAKAKGQGITLTEAHVYVVRSNAKKASPKSRIRRKGHSTTRTAATPTSRRTNSLAGSVEKRLVQAAAHLGLTRANELLERLHAQLQSL